MHLLCNQPEEVLFGCFMTTINATFNKELTLEDEGYESGSKNFNIPTTVRLTSRIHHVSSFHAPQLPASHITSLYATSYHSVALMKKKVLQLTLHLITMSYYHRTPWVLHSSHYPSPSTPYVMTQKKISKQLH